MKNFRLKSVALFICLSLLFAGCSRKDEEQETEEETSETATVSETTEEEVDESSPNPMFTVSAEDLVNSSSYDEICQMCQDSGLSLMPFDSFSGVDNMNFTQAFVAVDLGNGTVVNFNVDDYDDILTSLPDDYQDLFDSDAEALESFIATGEVPEGYEDIFEDIDLDSIEGWDDLDLDSFNIDDIDIENPPALFLYETDGQDITAFQLPSVSTVVCLDFESYEDALDFISNEYGTLTIEETDSGCVFSGTASEDLLATNVRGAISSDGLVYMVVSNEY